jgi:hypothetical protein
MASLNAFKAIWPSVSGLCTSLWHTLNSNFAQFNVKLRLNTVCLIDCAWHSCELVEIVIETWRRPFHEIYGKVLVFAALDQGSLCPTCECKFIFLLLIHQFFIRGFLKRNTDCLFLLPKLPKVFLYYHTHTHTHTCARARVCVCMCVCKGLKV